ncbi:MAG TPA: hypothetical protein VI461_11730, partial [Chitinophagaceae bacterium]|nr:hypothetical protein [Chitinophagaceae bacterium]
MDRNLRINVSHILQDLIPPRWGSLVIPVFYYQKVAPMGLGWNHIGHRNIVFHIENLPDGSQAYVFPTIVCYVLCGSNKLIG